MGGQIKRLIAGTAFRSARRYVANDTFFLREMGLPVRPGARPWREVAPNRWYLPNAVDPARFRPDPTVRPEPVILLARNFYRNRGIHLGIAAFARLVASHSVSGFDGGSLRLRIVGGPGDASYPEECRELAEDLGVTARVEFAGPAAWDAMPGEYRRAAVSVIPSLCGEGTSLAALESMACGTPVVATRAGGLPDLPCVHAGASPESLASAIDKVLRARDDVSRRQRETVEREYNLSRWGEAWLKVIDR